MAELPARLEELREIENATHTDACTVTRDDPEGEPTWDPVTGGTGPSKLTVHRDLPCRVREPSTGDQTTTAGEHVFQQGDAILRLASDYDSTVYDGADPPVGGPLRIGDTVSVASPQGVGMDHAFTVVWILSGSHMSAARFVIRKVL